MKVGEGVDSNAIRRSGRIVRAGFLAVMGLIACASLLAVLALRQANEALERLVYKEQQAMELQFRLLQAARDRSVEIYHIVTAADPFERDDRILRFWEAGGRFARERNRLLELELDAPSRALLEKQGRQARRSMALMEKVTELARDERRDDAIRLLLTEAIPAQDAMMATIDAMLEQQVGESRRKAEDMRRQQNLLAWLLAAAGVAAIFLAALVARYVGLGMKGLVGELAASAHALAEANRQLEYQKLAMDQHDIVSIADVHGNITYANDKFCEISQYSREELIGRNHRILKSSVHPQSFYDGMWDAIASGRIWKGEVCNRRKDGSLYWVSTTIVPILDESGLPSQYVSVRTDITDLKEAQQALLRGREELERRVQERTAELAEREEVLRSITRFAHDAVFMFDPGGKLTFWNPAAEKIFGYAESEALGRNLHALLTPRRQAEGSPDDWAEFRQAGAAGLAGKTFELAALRKDGAEIFVEISLSAVRIKGGWHAVGIARDMTARKQAERKLELLAATDALTGAYNRRRFDEALRAEIARCRRYGMPLSLVLFDIDHFKRINDSLGHPAGDEALMQLVRLVSGNIRETDLFARMGGEEFAILASGCDAESARRFAEKLRKQVETHAFPAVGRLTCSFGVAECRKSDEPEALVRRADEALYLAKGEGRNRVVVADSAAAL